MENVLNYLLNPSVHFLRKIFFIILIFLLAFIIDGYFGFSEFYYAKNKAEALIQISSVLKDSAISGENRAALQQDYNRIAIKESYKVESFRFIRSILFRSQNLTPVSINKQVDTSAISLPKNVISNSNSPSTIDFLLYLFSSGFSFWVTIFYFLIKLAASRAFRLIAPEQGVYKAIIILLVFAWLSGIIFLFIPPYEIAGFDRFMENLLLHFITVIIVLMFVGYYAQKKKVREADGTTS